MAADKEKENSVITGGFQITLQVSQQRQMTLTGHFYDTDTAAQRAARLDIYSSLMDRAGVRADLVTKRAQRENLIAQVKEHEDALTRLKQAQAEAKKENRHFKASSQEHQMLKTGAESIKGQRASIEMLDSLIAAAEKKLETWEPGK